MKKTRILLTEDDPNLGQILSEYLTLKGYDTVLCTDGEMGLEKYQSEPFDMCILDLMMPKKDGFSLAQDIRSQNTKIPIIFLTAKSMKEDVIKGFEIGGDDYVTKPFSMEELIARVEAILKRVKKNEQAPFPNPFKIGNIVYYYSENKLILSTQEIKLTTKENELLKLFFEKINQTVERKEALMKVWKNDSYFNARSMDVYITKLRKYLKCEESLKLITVHGEGFKLVQIT